MFVAISPFLRCFCACEILFLGSVRRASPLHLSLSLRRRSPLELEKRSGLR